MRQKNLLKASLAILIAGATTAKAEPIMLPDNEAKRLYEVLLDSGFEETSASIETKIEVADISCSAHPTRESEELASEEQEQEQEQEKEKATTRYSCVSLAADKRISSDNAAFVFNVLSAIGLKRDIGPGGFSYTAYNLKCSQIHEGDMPTFCTITAEPSSCQ